MNQASNLLQFQNSLELFKSLELNNFMIIIPYLTRVFKLSCSIQKENFKNTSMAFYICVRVIVLKGDIFFFKKLCMHTCVCVNEYDI